MLVGLISFILRNVSKICVYFIIVRFCTIIVIAKVPFVHGSKILSQYFISKRAENSNILTRIMHNIFFIFTQFIYYFYVSIVTHITPILSDTQKNNIWSLICIFQYLSRIFLRWKNCHVHMKVGDSFGISIICVSNKEGRGLSYPICEYFLGIKEDEVEILQIINMEKWFFFFLLLS